MISQSIFHLSRQAQLLTVPIVSIRSFSISMRASSKLLFQRRSRSTMAVSKEISVSLGTFRNIFVNGSNP